jgi:hypothetical protein
MLLDTFITVDHDGVTDGFHLKPETVYLEDEKVVQVFHVDLDARNEAARRGMAGTHAPGFIRLAPDERLTLAREIVNLIRAGDPYMPPASDA